MVEKKSCRCETPTWLSRTAFVLALNFNESRSSSTSLCYNQQQNFAYSMTANGSAGIIQPGIFEDLQKKIDEDSAVKDVRGTQATRQEQN